ncbi:hypothetical protein [Streptomyces mirabilis]|uniref:hypothetical protein n=1 Tax=Streptomyces mirabilis TaxID=68239 RepID=UPI00340209FB
MKIQIKGDISGSRNGVPWPKRGETMELPDDEGTAMCASGLAVPAADTDDDVETAVPDDADVETRSSGLTKASAGAVATDGSDEPKPADDGDQEPSGADDGDQADADSKDQAPAPAKKTAAPAKKTAAKRAPAKPQAESK